jgi:hypothetical protein
LRKGLQRESARFTPTEVASGEEALRGFREGTAQTDTFTIPNADGSGGLTVTPAQYEQMYLSDLQQRPAGYMVEQAVVPELGGRQYETLAAAEQAVAPSRAAGLANVYRQAGDVAEAEQLMGLSRGAQLQNLQISEAQRQQDFNTALQDLSTQEFTNPEDRTNATLAVYERFDPKGAVALRSSYTQNQLNEITIDAKKFEKDFTQARAKGLDSVIKWYDSVNDGFTLRRKGNQIIQTDAAGNEQVFAEGTNDEIMMRMDALATPGGYLNLAKAQKDMARSEEQRKLAEAQRLGLPAAAQIDAQRQNIALADQFRKQIADANKLLENYAEGTPQHNAVLAQRNSAARALTDVNRLLQPGGLTRSKTQPVAPDFDEAGRKAALDAASSGINPVTKKPFTKADKEKFQEYFGVKFPESAPAQSLKPASPRAARAARPDTIPPAPPKKITIGRSTRERDNPEYLEWERKYGTPSGLR